MVYTSGGIVSHGFSFNDFQFTYLLSGTVVDADVGKAVTLDTTAANTVKLAGDNDPVFGRLETFEDRAVLGVKVGTIARKFKQKLPAATGHSIVVGSSVTGSATAGVVKLATTQDIKDNRTIEIGTDFVVVEKL